MKVLVLGSSGFLGTHLMSALNRHGIAAVGASRRLNGIDASNYQQVCNFIKVNEVTHIINLAAHCGGIGLNKHKPFDLWYQSTAISTSVLAASIACSIQKLIMIGTVCSYPEHTPVPFREDYLMHYGPPEPTNRAYGVSKLNGLYGAQAAKFQYGLNVVNLIPVNMYGEYDNFSLDNSHVIPAIIRKIQDAINSNNDYIELWGSGVATREFLYAGDCSEAIIHAMLRIHDDSFYNVGSGHEISIHDLAQTISGLMGYKGYINWNISQPDGQMRRSLDTSKLKETINWGAQTSLSEGLKRTIEWYRDEGIRLWT